MTSLGLVSSLVASLVWPLTIGAVVVIFHDPLKNLIERIKKAEVAGQKFEFGPQLEAAEGKADEAVSDAKSVSASVGAGTPPGAPDESGTTPSDSSAKFFLRALTELPPEYPSELARRRTAKLAEEAEANPSFAILRAFEDLSSILADYVAFLLPNSKQHGRGALALLPRMRDMGALTPSYVDAVRDVQGLRNAVAHGQHNPTPGEAVAYVDTVSKLVQVAGFELDVRAKSGSSGNDAPE